MNTAMNQFDKAKGKLAGDFKAMISDSEDLLKAAATVSGEGFGAARSKFEERLKSAKAALADGAQSEYIRSNPWTAVGIAVAAGLVLGFIAGKR
jgi:ElaB/YqjD/DUF883 family membrane-anchored ribosome-binding protein